MSGVIGMTTYDATREARAIRGVPAVALRVGLALETWARTTAQREAARPVRVPHRIEADARVEHDRRAAFRLF
jgi:hypothetical protein